jgi:cytochrome c biogenesis protein CcdA
VPRVAAGRYAGSHPRPAVPAGRSIQSLGPRTKAVIDPYIPPSAKLREDPPKAHVWRWIAVFPAAVFGFSIAFALGLALSKAFDAFCSAAGQDFEGFCDAPWYSDAVGIALCVCAGAAAFLVVTLSAWTAPTHRRLVSWLAYSAGATLTLIYVYITTSRSLAPPACALVAGLMGVWVVRRFMRADSLAPALRST